MLYIIGLGLNEKSISLEGLEAINKCKEIYLEDYTVEFPYEIKILEKIVNKKAIPADRNFVESFEIIEKAKAEIIALLVYGSPLFATTHIALVHECKKQNIACEIIYNASILDAVAETGLQLYKFGKITSIPNFESKSFLETIKENQKINAHSLILVDIGLGFKRALEKLGKINEKIIVCSRLGTRDKKIIYGIAKELENRDINAPFCFIIPGKLHFMEEEVLKRFQL